MFVLGRNFHSLSENFDKYLQKIRQIDGKLSAMIFGYGISALGLISLLKTLIWRIFLKQSYNFTKKSRRQSRFLPNILFSKLGGNDNFFLEL